MPVSWSSFYPGWRTKNFGLDLEYSWSPSKNDQTQWLQVNSPERKKWLGVVTQGRINANHWVTSYQVSYSDDGVYWELADSGHNFSGNSDRSTHVKHWFKTPFWARSVRINPKSWHTYICVRVDFIYEG